MYAVMNMKTGKVACRYRRWPAGNNPTVWEWVDFGPLPAYVLTWPSQYGAQLFCNMNGGEPVAVEKVIGSATNV